MEYEFFNDPTTGKASAKFSLEHQNIGPWLEIELAKDTNKLAEILTAINNVAQGKSHEEQITGHEFSVIIEENDVTIQHNTMLNGSAELAEEVLQNDLHDDQFTAVSQCGLDDFHQLLLSWAKFVS